MSDKRLRKALRDFDFTSVFVEELGWNHLGQQPPGVDIDGQMYTFEPVAEKKGAQVFSVSPNADGLIPTRKDRRRIDHKVRGYAGERLLVFANRAMTKQIWLWEDRAKGKASVYREHEWHESQHPEGLVQKLNMLATSLEEEDRLTIVDMAERMEAGFNKETVTKKFYRDFATQRTRFLNGIEGFADQHKREWYASALLNRLMFVYFLQRKGFLDGDIKYLRNRLVTCQNQFGNDEFYSFYRTFLLKLFHEGLGAPDSSREAQLRTLIGNVPYLNGGLFQIHDLERDNPDIWIPDEAFLELFTFFDAWDWTLDYRPLADNNEINPDVLGYLFEQYINNKQMGAYYTKEDVTGYITRNTLLPFVLDDARRRYPEGFKGDQSVWRLLREDPDSYIYPAVQQTARDEKGSPLPLPDDIARGIDDPSQREAWNVLTPPTWGLPTEIWRESVARRERYIDVRKRLGKGEVTKPSDLVSLNLDIERFTLDAIETCESPELLRAFWKALRAVTVLDPTCGSGAFLFTALEQLEKLYTACLLRMQEFIGRLDTELNANPKSLSDFREELEEAYNTRKHPNLTYFVLKRILLDNLYGVDIMPEAVEICKLRLFLKLAAQVDPGGRLEPLPDIDFNIRAGNALVGYAEREEVRRGLMGTFMVGGGDQSRLQFNNETRILQAFEQQLEDVASLASRFREQQQTHGGQITFEDKQALSQRLQALVNQLDLSLATSYGVNVDDEIVLRSWRESHQPFHWFAEFYGVMYGGGFDVIVGNPPYVQYNAKQSDYVVRGYSTIKCNDLYAYVTERALNLGNHVGTLGLIVPISIMNTDNFIPLRQTVLEHVQTAWVSHFSNRPAQLFNGAQKRVSIVLASRSGHSDSKSIYTTQYYRWNSKERDHLLDSEMCYHVSLSPFSVFEGSLDKISTPLQSSAFSKLTSRLDRLGSSVVSGSDHIVYYTRSFQYFLAFLSFPPAMREKSSGIQRFPSELKTLSFPSRHHSFAALAVLSSSTFFWFWHVLSDCRNLNKRDIFAFPLNLDRIPSNTFTALSLLGEEYIECLRATSKEMEKSGMYIETFNYSACKPILDKIDSKLAEYYNFTAKELDFIVNYDIKYRLGVDSFDGKLEDSKL